MNRRPSIVQQTQLGPRRDNDAKGMPTQDPELTIGRMSRLYGVSLRRLRSHEDRGLNKTRREGNARCYRDRSGRMEMILRCRLFAPETMTSSRGTIRAHSGTPRSAARCSLSLRS